jgi:hypothetical protein
MSVKNYPVGSHFSGPIKLGSGSMRLSTDVGGLSAARTLTADESNGQHYILDGGTGFAITLPVATKGWKCKFTVGATFGTDFVVTAQSAIMEGCILEAGAVQDVAGATTLTLEDGVENVGDYLDLWSDGTSIFVTGNFLTALSITPA